MCQLWIFVGCTDQLGDVKMDQLRVPVAECFTGSCLLPPIFHAHLPQQIMDCQAPPVAAPMPAPAAPASLRPSATRELSEPRRTQVRLMVEGRATSWVTFFVCIQIFIFTQDTSCDTDNAYNIYTYCIFHTSQIHCLHTQQVYVWFSMH